MKEGNCCHSREDDKNLRKGKREGRVMVEHVPGIMIKDSPRSRARKRGYGDSRPGFPSIKEKGQSSLKRKKAKTADGTM